nr:transcription factor GTE12 [Tanacetum cinerariifolium]
EVKKGLSSEVAAAANQKATGRLSMEDPNLQVKVDPLNAQQTMEIIERKKLKEKSNIESQIRAARAVKKALLESAKSDLQLRRYKEIEKVEKNSEIGDNLTFLRELEKMCQYSGNPLEKIRSCLKEEYYYGYKYSDDGNCIISDELEDGEIF